MKFRETPRLFECIADVKLPPSVNLPNQVWAVRGSAGVAVAQPKKQEEEAFRNRDQQNLATENVSEFEPVMSAVSDGTGTAAERSAVTPHR